MTLTWTKNAKIRFEEILDYIEKELAMLPGMILGQEQRSLLFY